LRRHWRRHRRHWQQRLGCTGPRQAEPGLAEPGLAGMAWPGQTPPAGVSRYPAIVGCSLDCSALRRAAVAAVTFGTRASGRHCSSPSERAGHCAAFLPRLTTIICGDEIPVPPHMKVTCASPIPPNSNETTLAVYPSLRRCGGSRAMSRRGRPKPAPSRPRHAMWAGPAR
jgi:hypothetical protein